MRKVSSLWLGPVVLFGLFAIGANDCALTMIGQPVPPSSGPPPSTIGDMPCTPSNGQGGMGGGSAGLGGSDVGSAGLGGTQPRPKPQDLCGNSPDPLAGVPAAIVDTAALKANALAYYLDGMISSSGIDPSDQTAVAALLVQNGAMAEMVVDNWIAGLEPSAIPTAGPQPMPQCLDLKCPYSTKCFNSGPWAQQSYRCWVVGCGSSKCSACPSWFPDMVKSLAFDSWCAYACTDQTLPPNIVAVGAVGITKAGTPFPAAGAWCFAP